MVKKALSIKSLKPSNEWKPNQYQAAILAALNSDNERREMMERWEKEGAIQEIFPAEGTAPMLRRPINKDGVPGMPYKDEMNVLLNLRFYFKESIKYNEFARQIEINGRPMEDSDIMTVVAFMQTTGLMPGVHRNIVYSAVQAFAIGENKYNEPIDWLESLTWDGTERIESWLVEATGVEDSEYHRAVGAQWIMNGVTRRLYYPGCIWDYVLVLIGGQGIGKTSLFRILGGPWYKCFTGNVDNKDFYLKCRGTAILDLDEGASLSKSDSIKLKSIITETHDEYRAPYDATTKKYPRQFVFSMSTNSDEPFRDATGNRRYWPIDVGEKKVNFKYLEENRDQLFAESIYKLKNKVVLPEVPLDTARDKQEDHISQDSWMNDIEEYLVGENITTIRDIYVKAIRHDKMNNESIEHLDRRAEMRISEILKKLGFEKKQRREDGERKRYWERKEKVNAKQEEFNF